LESALTGLNSLRLCYYGLLAPDVRQQVIAGLPNDSEPEDKKATGNPKLSASMDMSKTKRAGSFSSCQPFQFSVWFVSF